MRCTKDNETKIEQEQRFLFGERYVGSSISKILSPKFAQNKINIFMEKPKNMLIYFGNTGVGKTYFCAAMTEWAQKTFGTNWRYFKENELLANLNQSMNGMQGGYQQVLKYMIDVELLIYDDAGSTKFTDWREDIFFEILDTRYNSMKPTIITTDLSEKMLMEKYNGQIHSRLFSKENIVIENMDGIDLRLKHLSDLENKVENYQK